MMLIWMIYHVWTKWQQPRRSRRRDKTQERKRYKNTSLNRTHAAVFTFVTTNKRCTPVSCQASQVRIWCIGRTLTDQGIKGPKDVPKMEKPTQRHARTSSLSLDPIRLTQLRKIISFLEEIKQEIKNLQQSVDSVLEETKQLSQDQKDAHSNDDQRTSHDDSDDTNTEGKKEQAAILKNIDFMESLEKEREEMDTDADHEAQQKEMRKIQILQEIEQLRQGRNNFNQIIDELKHQRFCPPRNFDEGPITFEADRATRCAFCELRGEHYSDKCPSFRDIQERWRILEQKGRCQLCLELYCVGEKSEPIWQQLANARDGLTQCSAKIQQLEKELSIIESDSQL
ncbi:unnamed protein product [Cylicocyclus nassatus]|uniref:CCHC-type domain-containing protein n=1 Tax=Cylicocyclus nassatus TaxID=53992 RepID=A0AA36M625_CYLNA|nr:unnamed protein product [Cylicocyclus nassatus]